MKRDQELIRKRNELIVNRYLHLISVKEFGVRKFTDKWIFNKLSQEEFFLAPTYIEKICFNRVK